jgi:hypothetical protein
LSASIRVNPVVAFSSFSKRLPRVRCYSDVMAQPANLRSPFQEGFAALREEPLLFLSELTWRWCFALSAWLLALSAAALFLDSIPVSALDRLLLGTLQPALEWSEIAHLFHGTQLLVVWVKFIVLAGLTLLWCLAATGGRTASLRNLVALFGGDDRDEGSGWQFWPMFQLHLVRALWTWTAVACFVVSFLLGSAMQGQQRAARAAFFYVFGIVLSLLFGVILNWFFGLAPLFCIRNQTSARDAVSLALDFCARQGGRLLGLSTAFFALRIVWAGSMFLLVLAPTGWGKHVAIGWVLLLMGFLTWIYLAGADALYLARLGAYAALAEIDAQPAPEPKPEAKPQSGIPLNPPLVEWDTDPTGFSPSVQS